MISRHPNTLSSLDTSISQKIGAYDLMFSTPIPKTHIYEFVIQNSDANQCPNPCKFHIPDNQNLETLSQVVQLMLEIEMAKHIVGREFVNLIETFRANKDCVFFWGWVHSCPIDKHDVHEPIAQYHVNHYDALGQKREVEAVSGMTPVLKEVAKIVYLDHQDYGEQCRALLEREMLLLQMQKNNDVPSSHHQLMQQTKNKCLKI